MKTKAIKSLEQKMEGTDPSSVRYKVLQSARDFKTSWIQLGRVLYSVWKDKLYKDWGYGDFDVYASKEIGIRKETAFKLLRSYSFLEKEEPRYLKKEFTERAETSSVPTYESVDVLRRARNKDMDATDYAKIRKYVLEDGKDAREVKKDLAEMIKQREELDPEDIRMERRTRVLKRFVGSLRSISREVRGSKLLPERIAKEAERLIEMIEGEL